MAATVMRVLYMWRSRIATAAPQRRFDRPQPAYDIVQAILDAMAAQSAPVQCRSAQQAPTFAAVAARQASALPN